MRAAKVTMTDGNHFFTSINGTPESISKYYAIGKPFNMGNGAGGDNMQNVAECEIIDNLVVNGYTIRYNDLFGKWQVNKQDTCQADFTHLVDAQEYAIKG